MKLIIDIPEEIKSYTDKYIPIGGVGEYCFPDEIVKMIQRGTPIPNNATNGDVIKALFPRIKIKKFSTFLRVIEGEEYIPMTYDWWNASYKRGDTE